MLKAAACRPLSDADQRCPSPPTGKSAGPPPSSSTATPPSQRGQAYVYLASAGIRGAVDSIAAASLRFQGEKNFQWFGAALAFTVLDGQRLVRRTALWPLAPSPLTRFWALGVCVPRVAHHQLIVGAPSHKIGDGALAVHEVGKVFGFDVARGSGAAPVFTIQGTDAYQRLGRCGQRATGVVVRMRARLPTTAGASSRRPVGVRVRTLAIFV